MCYLNLNDYQIYEGNRHSLTELELPHPKNINEALGYDLTDKHTTVASYGGVGNQTTNMHHGQGGKSDEADIDEKFFRFVAKRLMITILVFRFATYTGCITRASKSFIR
jgi:hypothetical protein